MPPKSTESNAAAQNEKRHRADSPASSPPTKKHRPDTDAGDASPSTDEILKYLLLDSTLDSISPPEILDAASTDLQYPHSDLPPFCSLICALLLSKPFNHRLGTRAIHHILNPPYSFTSPKSILDASGDDRWRALDEAGTLHKQKTSGQLRDLAELIREEYPEDFEGSELTQFRGSAKGDPETLRRQVGRIKGFAEKTTALFCRRVQGRWSELFPFADDLAIEAAKEAGLPVHDAQGLLHLLEAYLGDKVDEEEVRRKYVRVLDVLIGKKLDKDIDGVQEEASEIAEAGADEVEGGGEGDVKEEKVQKDTER